MSLPTIRHRALAASVLGAALLAALPSTAQTPPPSSAPATPSFTLTMRNRAFDPPSLDVPAGQKIELRVTNAETIAVEFESDDLRREKVIAPGLTVSIFIGPLRAGRYEFKDDFHSSTRGHLIAK
ncbi:MAG: cupredoxin domain-containing protein [Acetobacteraceae bacterium]|nr:cupredoxin domain-containing protein [Acetobacteraceae bacterium]MSP30754.1 cupredoxin domain-containing protein [Acetobacteraceae bacterium]